MNKEECENGLKLIHDCCCEEHHYEYEDYFDLFAQLIKEHFEQKENTSEFKHFKLHSDSTLMKLSKVELIDYIKMLYHNWSITDEKYSKILDDVHDYRYATHCMKLTIRNLCEHFGVKDEKELKNIYLCKPYKFEDLKVGMVVFDSFLRIIIEISFISIDGTSFLFKQFGKVHETVGKFEENRFYPVSKANEEVQ